MSIFQYPAHYHSAFGYSLDRELIPLLKVARYHQGGNFLIPACGTGRYAKHLIPFSRKTFCYDASEHFIRFASRSNRSNLTTWFTHRMQDPLQLNLKFDAVFCLNNSWRYLTDRQDSRSFLRHTRALMTPNATFVLSFGLTPQNTPPSTEPIEWNVRRRSRVITTRWVVQTDGHHRTTEEVQISVRGEKWNTVLKDSQTQRLCRLEDFQKSCLSVGLTLTRVCSLDGEDTAPTSKLPRGKYLFFVRRSDS